MLSQWLWFMGFSAEPVVVNNGGLCCVSFCESCCAIPSHWVEITVWICASGCESWWAMLRQWLWIMVRYAESVVVPLWAMLRQWLWITMCYAEVLVVWESWCVMLSQWLWIIVLCWAVCVGIKVCYSEPVVGNHGVNAMSVGVNSDELCWTSGCETLCVIMCQ
jgi:hypothetical protein